MSAFYLDLSCYDWLSMIQFPEFPHATFLASHRIESCNARALREGRPIDIGPLRFRHPEPFASAPVRHATGIVSEISDADVADRGQEGGYAFRKYLPPEIPVSR